ncbi:hypothetical protein [Pelagibius sp. Alg239-R121]|uniref:hypothetical protein n=1 Tax=Pelagibius sp. Alg239-R121 TaxID=2993448 RepID=UPI0024A72FC0|nr:hypothetical protein [Pelagibius sp. Alg239-R121]
MANTHTVTVHVWDSDDQFEKAADGDKTVNLNAPAVILGHASLKLQHVGAAKGDYYYLSFWPEGNHEDRPAFGGNARNHQMPLRHGPGSEAQALAAANFKKFDSSNLGAESNDISSDWEDEKPTTTYRINGLNMARMVGWVQNIQDKTMSDYYYHLIKHNCATAIAQCLEVGGAPNKPAHNVWTPRRVGVWCEQLVVHFNGQKKTAAGVQNF